MNLTEFIEYVRTLPKYCWPCDSTRLPMYHGQIIAAQDVCYTMHGSDQQMFQLSQLKAVVEKLGK